MKKTKKKKAKKKVSNDRPVVVEGETSTAYDGQNGNRVFVSLAKTINMGNYESMRVEYGEGRTVHDGENFADVRNACAKEALENLGEIIQLVEKVMGKY